MTAFSHHTESLWRRGTEAIGPHRAPLMDQPDFSFHCAAKSLVNALPISRADYCGAFLLAKCHFLLSNRHFLWPFIV